MEIVSTTSFFSWCPPPEMLMLDYNEVHVWRASLDTTPWYQYSLQQHLTADERARADRFYFSKDRDHFIVARGTLRAILSRYLNKAPAHLCFRYNAHGKPSLVEEAPVNFNLSHSHGLALYAVTCDREVGIDLEYMRAKPNLIAIAERFFSPQEVAEIHALPINLRYEAFFNCWTRKEAYIKAKGKGLAIPLSQFDVSLIPGKPAALLDTKWHPQEAARWSLQALTPHPNYAAALAVEGHRWHLKCWEWTG